MTYTVTSLESYDNKRNKVILDYGEVTFLLYKGECAKLSIREGTELDEDKYGSIIEDILIPRAKKRTLYYLKNADKTRFEINRRLKMSLYPGEVIEKVGEFLDGYGIADDSSFADRYIDELKGYSSRREIEAKLSSRGLCSDDIREKLCSLTEEDERAACTHALRKRYPSGVPQEDRGRARAYLARKGYGSSIIDQVMKAE